VRDQLELIRLRNKSPAFEGTLEIHDSDEHRLHMTWTHHGCVATLNADLRNFGFSVKHKGMACAEYETSYR
jgi:sucrose phosphorylase